VTGAGSRTTDHVTRHPSPVTRLGFTLIEVMLVMVLLSLIVIALMTVFSSTQAAFRASVTQTDVLEGGRAAMDLISGDLRAMSPSGGTNNSGFNGNFYLGPAGPVNFAASVKNPSSPPLIQALTASSALRTNVLEDFFILSRENQTWTGVGYAVDTKSSDSINPLYRFSMSTNVATANPLALYNIFVNDLNKGVFTNMSHLMDGVIGLRVRAYDLNGLWLTNGYTFGMSNTLKNTAFAAPYLGEIGFYMSSNSLPASVEIEMATLEDRTLQRASIWANGSISQSNYLTQQAGKVHLFRQRVTIPKVDPAAYR
jgi:prepilin-type N-terminal cleavage/methylation domain-containing protein